MSVARIGGIRPIRRNPDFWRSAEIVRAAYQSAARRFFRPQAIFTALFLPCPELFFNADQGCPSAADYFAPMRLHSRLIWVSPRFSPRGAECEQNGLKTWRRRPPDEAIPILELPVFALGCSGDLSRADGSETLMMDRRKPTRRAASQPANPPTRRASRAIRPERSHNRELLPFARPITFIDLFCGIGGFRLGFERAGGQCVFSCDWDKHARKTYEANFGEEPFGDINAIAPADIPEFDILCGGFPCQPFSIAGVSKKQSLGMKHGFEDKKQGNLFFSIADIIAHHRPPAFVLENVKHLQRHDKGRTYQVIIDTLQRRLGYHVHAQVIDARVVVPQHRERIFLVGFREDLPFSFPPFPAEGPKLGSILDPRPPQKYTLTDHLWNYLQNYAEKHRAAGNGFGYGLVTRNDVARTLSARYYKDGSEILISQGRGRNPRRLTPQECARLMGFPDDFVIPVSDTQAYRQFGNSIVVPVVQRVAEQVIATLAPALDRTPRKPRSRFAARSLFARDAALVQTASVE